MTIQADPYWLTQVRVPQSLLSDPSLGTPIPSTAAEHLMAVHLEISGRHIRQVRPATAPVPADAAVWEGRQGLVWPCFVDLHTHLDKGHIWPRQPNPTGTFAGALAGVGADQTPNWSAADLYARMDFGLRCSYAHGTRALRTHLDSHGQQGAISFEVFRQLQQEWAGRIELQAVCLVAIDMFSRPEGEALADLVAAYEGILGAVIYPMPQVAQHIDRAFTLAAERGLALDFHVDETLNPDATGLSQVAAAKLHHRFDGPVVCGHCCSLSVQSPLAVDRTLDLVQAAAVGIVSLPTCNLYLQDRRPPGETPRRRGVTLLQELHQAGVPVALASDNCRDPFFAYGDHDLLDVFNQSVRIGHLDCPFGDWPQAVTHTPATLMGLAAPALIGPGTSADFVLFKARSLNELLCRPQSDRKIVRQGRPIDTTLPDYAELDDLMEA